MEDKKELFLIYRGYDDFSGGGVIPHSFTDDEKKAEALCKKQNEMIVEKYQILYPLGQWDLQRVEEDYYVRFSYIPVTKLE